MPEGDTVWRVCQRLNEVLAGRTLTRCEFRVPSLATTDLTGVGLREVVSRGKHQLFRLANDYTLHTHFRMEGSWRIYPAGRPWTGGPEFQIRAVLGTAEHACVGYRLPMVELLPSADEDEVVRELWWDSPESRKLLRDLFADVRTLVRDLGLMNPVSVRVWRAAGIYGRSSRYRSEPASAAA